MTDVAPAADVSELRREGVTDGDEDGIGVADGDLEDDAEPEYDLLLVRDTSNIVGELVDVDEAHAVRDASAVDPELWEDDDEYDTWIENVSLTDPVFKKLNIEVTDGDPEKEAIDVKDDW